jgi:hypothetical protein
MKPQRFGFRRVAIAGLAAIIATLGGLAKSEEAQSSKPFEIRPTGNVSYFAAGKAKSGCPTSYPEINHSTDLPYSTNVCGFLDFYGDNQGYFGKTIIEKNLGKGFNLRSHLVHSNDPLSQAGFGLSYALPTPKETYAKVGVLPFFVDSEGNSISHKQALCFAAGVNLPHNFSLSAFGEINPYAEKGPEWCYGEVGFEKNFGKHLSTGLNIQLNNKASGKLSPEGIPRFVIRANF